MSARELTLTAAAVGLVLVVCGMILRNWFNEIDSLRGRVLKVERLGDPDALLARLGTLEDELGNHGEWITSTKERFRAEARDRKETANLAERREFRKALGAVLSGIESLLAAHEAHQHTPPVPAVVRP